MTVNRLQFDVRIFPAEGDHSWVPFDDALAALEQLPRMFIEPDGSFVWVVEAAGERWQLDGLLVDRGPMLECVELLGRCDEAMLEQFLARLDWPETKLAFEDRASGQSFTESQFRASARQP